MSPTKVARTRAAGAALALTVALTGCVAAEPQVTLDEVARAVSAVPQESGRYTTAPCDFWSGCVSSIATNHVSVFQFASVEDAARTATQLGTDGHQSGTYLIRFDDTALTADARALYITAVESAS